MDLELAVELAEVLAEVLAEELAVELAEKLAVELAEELAEMLAEELEMNHDLQYLKHLKLLTLMTRSATAWQKLLENYFHQLVLKAQKCLKLVFLEFFSPELNLVRSHE